MIGKRPCSRARTMDSSLVMVKPSLAPDKYSTAWQISCSSTLRQSQPFRRNMVFDSLLNAPRRSSPSASRYGTTLTLSLCPRTVTDLGGLGRSNTDSFATEYRLSVFHKNNL
jgi:hypothetical protein